jgi:hypothetical protein
METGMSAITLTKLAFLQERTRTIRGVPLPRASVSIFVKGAGGWGEALR